MKAVLAGTVIAEADESDLIRIEGNWYFPPSSLAEGEFATSATAYHCPWKGDAQYWDVGNGDDRLADGAWSYPEPLPGSVERVGHEFAGYVAFDKRVTVEE